MKLKKHNDYWNEIRIFKLAIIIYCINVLVRIALTLFTKVAVVEPDEIGYLKMAMSLANNGNIRVNNIPYNYTPVLYPILISPFFALNNKIISVMLVGVFNSLLISSCIFPVYILSKKMLVSKKLRILLLIIISILPDLAMNITFMTENLFIPLCSWFFLFIYLLLVENNQNKKYFYSCCIGFLCLMLYITKNIALYFVISVTITFIIRVFIDGKEKIKENIVSIIIFLISFISFYLLFRLLFVNILLGSEPQGISTNISWKFKSFYDFIFYIYINIFATTHSLIAFFYFPVIIPIIIYNRLEKRHKLIVIFALSSMITAIGVNAYLTSLTEHYGSIIIWQNIRYYSPLLILFLVILFSLYENYDFQKIYNKTFTVGFTVFASMIIVYVFKIYKGGLVESVLLKVFQTLANKSKYINEGIRQFSISYLELSIKLIIIIAIILITYGLIKSKKKTFTKLIIIIVVLCIVNSYYTIDEFRNVYASYATMDKINEVYVIEEFLKQSNGKTLVITDGFDKVLNTYLEKDAYFVFENELLEKYEMQDFIDLSSDKLRCQYPNVLYSDMKNVDYIITDNTPMIDLERVNEIQLSNIVNYRIFKNNDNTKIYLDDNGVFPFKVGESKIIRNDSLYTQHKVNETGFISIKEGDALVYGPYAPISKGTYLFEIKYYHLINIETQDNLAYMDFIINDTTEIVATQYINNHKNIASMEVNIDHDANSAEVRIIPYYEGLVIESIRVTKIN